MTTSIVQLGNTQFFKDVKFTGGDIVRDFAFEEENVNIPTYIIGINQGLIPNFVQDTLDQDNIGVLLYKNLFQKNKL